MSTAPIDLSSLDLVDQQNRAARLQALTQAMPLPQPVAPPGPDAGVGSFEDLQQRAAQAPLQLGQALQNQQQQFGQTQNDLERAQTQLADPYQRIQEDLVSKYQQLGAARHVGVKNLLQNFFSGMSHGMLPVEQTPEFQQNRILGQMIQVENARSLAGLREAQTANLQLTERTLPDGTVIQLPLSQAARFDAADVRGQLANQKPGNLDDQIGRLVYGDLQAGRDPNANPTIKQLLGLRAQMQKPQQTDTALANKEQFQTTVGKLAAAGLPTDPKSLPGSFATGLKRGLISQQEYADAAGYAAANPTPSTNLQVTVAGAGAKEEIKEGAEWMALNGRIVRSRDLTQAQQSQAVPVKDPDKAQQAINSTNSVLSSFSQYQRDINASQLTPNDIEALKVLTNTEAVAHGFYEKEASGLLDTILPEPLTGYSQKLMGNTMTLDQYNKLSPAGKKLLVGYYDSLISNFADMKQRLGSIGRNESMIQAEIHTVPLPFIDKQSSNEMLNRKRQSVMGRNIYLGGTGVPSAPGGSASFSYDPRTDSLTPNPQAGDWFSQFGGRARQ